MNQQKLEKVTWHNEDEEIEIDLLDLLNSLRVHWLLICLGVLAGAILAFALTKCYVKPKYTATSKLYMVSSSKDSVVDLTDLDIGTSLSNDYAELIKARPIVTSVITQLHLNYTYQDLLGMMTITTVNNTRILRIDVTSTKPKEAKDIANALANEAISKLAKLMDTSKPHLVESAILPQGQSSPNMKKNVLVGAVLGLVLVCGIFTVLYLLDDTLNTAEDVEKAFGILPLTTIPECKVDAISDRKEAEIDKQHKKELRKKRREARNNE